MAEAPALPVCKQHCHVTAWDVVCRCCTSSPQSVRCCRTTPTGSRRAPGGTTSGALSKGRQVDMASDLQKSLGNGHAVLEGPWVLDSDTQVLTHDLLPPDLLPRKLLAPCDELLSSESTSACGWLPHPHAAMLALTCTSWMGGWQLCTQVHLLPCDILPSTRPDRMQILYGGRQHRGH